MKVPVTLSGGNTHLMMTALTRPFFCGKEAALGTAGGQLVKGVGLLNRSDLL